MLFNMLRFILAFLALTALMGCRESENSTGFFEGPVSVSFDQEFVLSEESTVFILTGAFPRPNSVELSQAPDIGITVQSFRNNELSLSVPSIDRPVTSSLELRLVYAGQSTTQHVSISVKNTSEAALTQQADQTVAEQEAILDLAQDSVLYQFFVDYAYLNDLLTHSEKQQLLANFAPEEDAPFWSEVRTSIENLATEIAAYQQGDVSDQTLEQSLALVEESILKHGDYGAGLLEDIRPLVDELLVSGLGSGELSYVPEAGIYSRILSTAHYGVFSDTGFQVAENYRPIESLIRSRSTQSLMCEIF